MRPLSPQDIRERRQSQLARFFPVTLERLAFSKSFQEIKQQGLNHRYLGWQIDQAACNLVLRHRPHLFETAEDEPETASDSPQMRILEFILEHFETVTGTELPEQELGLDNLIEQIRADSRELLAYVQPEAQVADDLLQDTLGARGLLEE